MLCRNPSSSTYAATGSARLGVAADGSAALGAGIVREVDENSGGLHVDFGSCFERWSRLRFGVCGCEMTGCRWLRLEGQSGVDILCERLQGQAAICGKVRASA